jgi:hypothetical protein
MVVRYFLQVSPGGLVHARLRAARAEWSDVEIPPDLREVSAATYAAVPDGSTANADGTYTPPAPVVAPRRLTKFAFLRLLTPTEYAAMFGPQDDPLLAYGVAMFNAAPDPFNIDDPLVAQMLDYCVQVGVITAPRRAELWGAMEAASHG